MSTPPSVSVLLPIRNAATDLPECIASLNAQTFEDFEVIAVDDGSTDRTPDLLTDWARRDPRIQVVQQGPRGLVPALEVARARARGRYLARMDADDACEPERLAKQHALVEARAELVGCGCLVRYFPHDRVRGGARRYQRWLNGLVEPEEIENDLFVECPLAHPTFFMRADVVARVGGYRERGWPEDYDLVLRLWEVGGRFAKVPEVLLRWRESPDRLSRVHPSYGADAFRRLKIHFLQRTLLRDGRGTVVWGAGPTGKAFARALLSAGGTVRAFVDLDPRKIGQTVHGAPVLSPESATPDTDVLNVAAIAQPGGREELRGVFRQLGWRQMHECVVVA